MVLNIICLSFVFSLNTVTMNNVSLWCQIIPPNFPISEWKWFFQAVMSKVVWKPATRGSFHIIFTFLLLGLWHFRANKLNSHLCLDEEVWRLHWFIWKLGFWLLHSLLKRPQKGLEEINFPSVFPYPTVCCVCVCVYVWVCFLPTHTLSNLRK